MVVAYIYIRPHIYRYKHAHVHIHVDCSHMVKKHAMHIRICRHRLVPARLARFHGSEWNLGVIEWESGVGVRERVVDNEAIE